MAATPFFSERDNFRYTSRAALKKIKSFKPNPTQRKLREKIFVSMPVESSSDDNVNFE